MPQLKTFYDNNVSKYIGLIFIVLSGFMLYRRNLLYTNTAPSDFDTVVYYIRLWFPCGLIPLAIIPNRFLKWLLPLFSNKTVVTVCYVAIMIVTILFIFKIAVPTGIWTSYYFVFGGLLLVYSMMRKYTGDIQAFLLGVGLVCMMVGIWEIPYQWGMKLINDAPQLGRDVAINMAWCETIKELPTILGGAILVVVVNIKNKILSVKPITVLLLLMYIYMVIYLVCSGFWTDLWYDWSSYSWVSSQHFDVLSMFLIKGSKAILLLFFISLLKVHND